MSKGKLFNLCWVRDAVAPGSERKVPVALQEKNVIDDQKPIDALVLYPAFFTPAIHVSGQTDDMFEVLILSNKKGLTRSDINFHLKIAVGLSPDKPVANGPLFANPVDKIEIAQVNPDGNGIVATKNVFAGILDQRFTANAAKGLDTYYALRIHASCLKDPSVIAASGRNAAPELQDEKLVAMLDRRNGTALREKGGRGHNCFATSANGADLSKVDPDQPIRAYHPLFFYENPEAVTPASFGHVSDIHVNVRQQTLQHSPARVIDDPAGLTDSPPLGPMVNICGANLASITDSMGGDDEVDILMVGGDLIDHIQNVYPYPAGTAATALDSASARQIWDLMDLRDRRGYATHYQAFVDFIVFFGVMTRFYRSHNKPIYGITGNHDCYEEAYGTSPRVMGRKANEGIPADLNLTFYEAILIFGETFDTVRRGVAPPNYTPDLLEWFYTVFTPFADFVVALPKQRVVGLAWGEEESILRPKGQGFGHLPRANEAVTDGQLALFRRGLGTEKRTALLTHFTFVSYDDSIPINPPPGPLTPRSIETTDSFGKQDLGTFEKNRAALYGAVADPKQTQFVVTGHSHRKGLYFLGAPGHGGYATEMHGLRHPFLPASMGGAPRTPIVVSDSSGPLPRLNLDEEFDGWGSDRPAGTRILSAPDGSVARVEAVPATGAVTQPRLAVAVDYLHNMKSDVFDEIETYPFDKKKPRAAAHGINFTFERQFTAWLEPISVVLYGKPSVTAPWIRVPLGLDSSDIKTGGKRSSFLVDPADAGAFYDWLTLPPKTGRFASFKFQFLQPSEQDSVYDLGSAWNIELDCRPAHFSFLHSEITYVLSAKPDDSYGNSRPVVEGPSFDWRRRFPAYQ